MSENKVVKYDEMGVIDGGTIGLPRPMSRDLWLQEVFPGRISEALNAKVVIPMHHDNWGNCYEGPEYLEYIISHKAKEKGIDLRTVSLLPGARYEHPTDMNMGRYVYPDWRERMNWKKSVEYGPDAW